MKKKKFKIDLSDEAEKDFEESYNYYLDQNEKVADKFYNEVNKSLDAISTNPDIYVLFFKDIKKYVLKKFPFIIYYQFKDLVVKVIAIFHTSRNPEIWKKRNK